VINIPESDVGEAKVRLRAPVRLVQPQVLQPKAAGSINIRAKIEAATKAVERDVRVQPIRPEELVLAGISRRVGDGVQDILVSRREKNAVDSL